MHPFGGAWLQNGVVMDRTGATYSTGELWWAGGVGPSAAGE